MAPAVAACLTPTKCFGGSNRATAFSGHCKLVDLQAAGEAMRMLFTQFMMFKSSLRALAALHTGIVVTNAAHHGQCQPRLCPDHRVGKQSDSTVTSMHSCQ